MSKMVLYGDEARDALVRGVDQLGNVVKVTVGPKGRNVVLDRHFGVPLLTNDGVSIAKEMDLKDPFENMGAQLVKEVSSKTNDSAGDGTTTATILAQAMVHEGIKNISAGANPVIMKRGIQKAVDLAVSFIRNHAQSVAGTEDVAKVGTISSGDESIGALIANTMDKLSLGAVITVEESRTSDTSCEIVEGMEFDRGFMSSHMITDQKKMEAVLDDPYILLTDQKISTDSDIFPLMEKVQKTGRRLFIIADDIENEPLATIIVNKVRGKFSCACAKAPSFGDNRKELLEDMAAITGATVISEDLGMKLKDTTLDMLGSARQIKSDKDRTIIIGGNGDPEVIAERIQTVKTELSLAQFDYDIVKLNERIGKLSGGVAVIRVGAPSEVEMQEKKLRIEDALNATRAAVEEGIVPGGGSIYVEASKEVSKLLNTLDGDEKTGASLVTKALTAPICQIADNAGAEGAVVLDRVISSSEYGYGYNAEKDCFDNMMEAGVIDPAKVCRLALENAASVASELLTTEVLIADEPSDPNTGDK